MPRIVTVTLALAAVAVSGNAAAEDAMARFECRTGEAVYRLELPVAEGPDARVDGLAASVSVQGGVVALGYRAGTGERVVITVDRQDHSFRKQTYIIPYQYARTETGRCAGVKS